MVHAFSPGTLEALRWALWEFTASVVYTSSRMSASASAPQWETLFSRKEIRLGLLAVHARCSQWLPLCLHLVSCVPDASHQGCCRSTVLKLRPFPFPNPLSVPRCYFSTSGLSSARVFIGKQLCDYVLSSVSQTEDFKLLIFRMSWFSKHLRFPKWLLCRKLI